MISPVRGTAIRLISPSDSAPRILTTLGPQAKVESSNLVLTAGRLTTEGIVRGIRELARSKDEVLHAMRQLGIPREARKSNLERPDYNRLVPETQAQLEEKRKQCQDAQSKVEALERQIGEAKKEAARISEVVEAGFASAGAPSATGRFNRLLGRLPVRKLEAAQRALQFALRDEVVFSIGNRKKDWVYLLVAAPTDKTSITLQTLILYDFTQTETPSSEAPDLKNAFDSLQQKQDILAKQLNSAREELRAAGEETASALNELADKIQDSLIMLRGVLKLGEGTKVFHTFAWMEKNPSPKVIAALTAQGALVETE